MYLKSLLSFESVALEFGSGLVVLSGPSGAGKSVLMNSILSSLGIMSAEAKLCEITLNKPTTLSSDVYELEEELVVRSIKKDRTRHYLNDQNISKKALRQLFSPFIHYLSVRDISGFESEALVNMLDGALNSADKNYKKMLKEYKKRYSSYKNKLNELEIIRENETKLSELIEFTSFEINKIKAIDPKTGEDTELLVLKKQLSKIDKINDALQKAEEIFLLEGSISDIFRLMDKDGGYFSDTMNQLRSDFEETQSLTSELEDMDVEKLLNRLEQISELKNRYGSIEEAISYCIKKEEELAGYDRISEDKSALESFLKLEYAELLIITDRITQARMRQAKLFSGNMKQYLSRLKLAEVIFVFEKTELSDCGTDSVDLHMQNSSTATLSGGEHNRLRLALMLVSLETTSSCHGTIVLDEIDANVSGDESIAIADMISKLATNYQIFAISHQPHLAAKANQHILVDKLDGKSRASILNQEGRIVEIARIIGGEVPADEAIAFSRRLLK